MMMMNVMEMARNAQRVEKGPHAIGGSDAEHFCTCLLPDELEHFAALVRNATLEEVTRVLPLALSERHRGVIRAMKVPV